MKNFNQINGERRARHNRNRKQARKLMHFLGGSVSEEWKKIKIKVMDKVITTIETQKELAKSRHEKQLEADRKAMQKMTIGVRKPKKMGKIPVGS